MDSKFKIMFALIIYVSKLCLSECPCFTYAICVCLCLVVSNTSCVVFLFCCSSSCVPYVASFPEVSILDCPFGSRKR